MWQQAFKIDSFKKLDCARKKNKNCYIVKMVELFGIRCTSNCEIATLRSRSRSPAVAALLPGRELTSEAGVTSPL